MFGVSKVIFRAFHGEKGRLRGEVRFCYLIGALAGVV